MAELDIDLDAQLRVNGPVTGLTIAEIETVAIRVPLARTYHGSAYKMTHRSTIVTRIRTEAGVLGEAYCGDEDAGLHEIDGIIRNEIAPRLIGEDAFRVERCWELARPATFDILRDRRLGLVATACVDAAIWDAIGKALGQPLHRLWGGYRDSLPVMTIGGYYGTQEIAAEVGGGRGRGRGGGAGGGGGPPAADVPATNGGAAELPAILVRQMARRSSRLRWEGRVRYSSGLRRRTSRFHAARPDPPFRPARSARTSHTSWSLTTLHAVEGGCNHLEQHCRRATRA